jgi:hypothetical protein
LENLFENTILIELGKLLPLKVVEKDLVIGYRVKNVQPIVCVKINRVSNIPFR